jgi:S-adenosylmethionine:tRNA ribosyltransferase-isomerase
LFTSDFNYQLPSKYIAQVPVEPRDSARLMVLNRNKDQIEHCRFSDLENFLDPGDLLVLNETRVIPGRLFGIKVPTGGRVEILLLRNISKNSWEVMVGGKGLSKGQYIQLDGGPYGEITDVLAGPIRVINFTDPIENFLDDIGQIPLPPYIHIPLDVDERYQTVYSKELGSAAAPTAGLHFTKRLLSQLKKTGVNFTSVVLHVGLDTFVPVKEDNPLEHKIHTEWCRLTRQTADLIRQTKKSGKRVIAVGTTSVRTLESAGREAEPKSIVTAFEGSTDLFILPGYQFRVVDGLITNFHLPRSTLLMLVSAFAGREKILNAYEIAKDEGYRFYSFGDAMFIT